MEAIRSTQKILTILRMMGASPFELTRQFTADENPCDNSLLTTKRFKDVLELLQPSSGIMSSFGIATQTAQPPISDLQSTIRRKVPRGSTLSAL